MLTTIIEAENSTEFEANIGPWLINKKRYDPVKTSVGITPIGTGSYGDVYHIRRIEINYALKEQYYDRDTNKLKNMLKEAILQYILYKNSETSFPKIFEVAWTDEYFYILMEYLDPSEGTILNKLPDYSTVESQKTDAYMLYSCEIATKIARILKPLQESLKFSHGDLNKGNLYVKKDNSVKLLDFGFSSIKLGENTIVTSTFNTNYKSGKDLTIFIRTVLYHIGKNRIAYSEPAKSIYNTFSNIIAPYSHAILTDTSKFYSKLDNDDNELAKPDKILEDLNNCSENIPFSAISTPADSPAKAISTASVNQNSSRTSVGGTRTRRLIARRRASRKKISIKLSGQRSINKGIKMSKSPVDLIHDKKSRFNSKSLEKILKTSSLDHIKNNASKIATLYLNEKEYSLDLDLFKILLYYDGENFDTYANEYSELKTLPQKQMYLYGTDFVRSTYIHWNTKDTGIKI
jgi:tRNA A-37 threonylcarbamoyl transferase component Bud32